MQRTNRIVLWNTISPRDTATYQSAVDVDVASATDVRLVYRDGLDQAVNLTALMDFGAGFSQAGTPKNIAAAAGTGVLASNDASLGLPFSMKGGKLRINMVPAVAPGAGTFYGELQITYDV